MKVDRETATLLRKASEDYAGLWELSIALRSIGIVDPAGEARRVAARLMDEGLIYAVWGDPEPNEGRVLSSSEWQAALRDDALWDEDVPYGGRTAWVSATAEGDRIAFDLDPIQ